MGRSVQQSDSPRGTAVAVLTFLYSRQYSIFDLGVRAQRTPDGELLQLPWQRVTVQVHNMELGHDQCGMSTDGGVLIYQMGAEAAMTACVTSTSISDIVLDAG